MSAISSLFAALVAVGASLTTPIQPSAMAVEPSGLPHDAVVTTAAARITPHLVDTGAYRPYALTIHRAGRTVIVGGMFDKVENSQRTVRYTRSHVFTFDTGTGAVSAFAPRLNGRVWSVVGDGDSVFVGGEFTTVNGSARPYLAKLSLSTGQLDPTFAPVLTGGRVTDLQLAGGRLLVSGAFSGKLVALDPVTGADTGYLAVPIEDPLRYTSRTEVARFDVSPDGTRLVGVGNFRTVGGATRYRAFMLDLGLDAATVSPWRYTHLEKECHAAQTSANYQAYVHDVDFSPTSQFFTLASSGGHRINGEGPGRVICDSAARFSVANLAPAAPVWINYTGGDTLHSVVDTGAAVYVQGHSRWLNNPYGRDYAGAGAVSRPGGGAIHPQTGKALAWNPDMPATRGGYGLYADQYGVWFATDGIRWGGQHRYGIRLARLY